ncbi:MAG: MT-A70 family methyltransferase [Chloroflexi bacterium]|nr:MT-A70 family methyltransferase [Chloroflexota bacterium]MCY4247690.1 MT-A70 family methyltransferase [Chloroflexota bacterium]
MVSEIKTSYSVYNEEVKTRTQGRWLGNLFAPLPTKRYDIVYADPPWHYNGKLQYDRSGVAENNNGWQKPIFVSSACFKYPTIVLEDLMTLPIQFIAKQDCLLFMWTTNPHLAQAIELGTAWGFEYKTVAFVWNKMNHNPGHYTLSYCELCLLFKRGRIPKPRGARNVKQLIEARRNGHSEKPIEVAEGIVKMFPSQSKIELFARDRKPGFDAWGLDILNQDVEQCTQ